MYKKQAVKRQGKPQAEPKRNNIPFIIAGAVIGVIVLIALLVVSLNSEGEEAILGGIEGVNRTTGLVANQHVENPVYPDNQLPPPGGVHAPTWQNCGIYRQPLEARFVVHSLEHGAVWITYDPNIVTEEQIEDLEALIKAEGRGFTVLSPYPDQNSPMVATAWGYQLEMESPEDERLEQFLATYVLGPQTPERGASCSGAVGNPIL
ncbi:MAG: DUF3105 domain-containing protein [Chloroflexi bacterium]|nr:DUF3105 domain-containing protein [Chloroflexota bacterium]